MCYCTVNAGTVEQYLVMHVILTNDAFIIVTICVLYYICDSMHVAVFTVLVDAEHPVNHLIIGFTQHMIDIEELAGHGEYITPLIP